MVSYMDEVESVYARYTLGSVETMSRLREPQVRLNVQVGTYVDKVGLVQYLNI
jgi:serine acetyltransferase